MLKSKVRIFFFSLNRNGKRKIIRFAKMKKREKTFLSLKKKKKKISTIVLRYSLNGPLNFS